MNFRPHILALALALPAAAQQARTPLLSSADQAPAARTRLILKDGTYQMVLDYKVSGKTVRYHSAERNGAAEDIPLALVDIPATERFAREHTPGQAPAPVLSPALAREEADRAALTPEVATDLRLPEEDAVLALDHFRGAPELVPLAQQLTDLNKETAHAVQKLEINPSSSAHRIADIPEIKADVQLHVPDPIFFVRIGNPKDDEQARGAAITVDTRGVLGRETPGVSSPNSTYVLERIDVRTDQRRIDSFRIAELGNGRPQRDIIELKHEDLPGGHWLKLTPTAPLDFGEYALVEILNDREVNLDVWDFGIHPEAKENSEALRRERRRAPTLQTR